MKSDDLASSVSKVIQKAEKNRSFSSFALFLSSFI